MRLKIEEIQKVSRILFLFKKNEPLVKGLDDCLKKYRADIFTSLELPDRIDHFDNIFIFDDQKAIEKLLKSPPKSAKTLILLFGKSDKLRQLGIFISKNRLEHIKIVNVDKEEESVDYVDKILWFLYSTSSEKILDLARGIKKRVRIKTPTSFSISVSKKKLFISLAIIILFIQFFFVIPLLGGFLFLYQSAKALQASDIAAAQNYLNNATPLVSLTNRSYKFSRPIFSFFYLALLPDDLILIQNSASKLLTESVNTLKNGQKTVLLILDSDKTELEQEELLTRIDLLKKAVGIISSEITTISNKISGFKLPIFAHATNELMQARTLLEQVKKVFNHVDSVIGGSEEKKYLILFQNNMELRPGGGFIGSYALVTFANYTLKEFKVEDVYEADGQLKAHIEPPLAIKTYLNQPHWFLRDSNFSPDFEKNFKNAEFFLYKELGVTGLDGAAAISTTAISYFIEAFGKIYLPDYNETITSENFYIKTQINSQENFFPGSKQKKNFLSSLVDTLLFRLESVSFKDLGLSVKRALDEKQIVLYFKDEKIQKDIDLLGFGGRIVTPFCAQESESQSMDSQPCITDTIFPVDANLGVNKANFFIKKMISIKTTIDKNGSIEKLFTEAFQNDSAGTVFPGGTYKNYFQLYIPKNTTIKEVTFDGKPISLFEETIEDPFKIIGLYIEVMPKTTSELKVRYSLDETITKSKVLYQLVIQKQIGDTNSDVVLQFYYPANISAKPQNFSTLANEGSLVYNTSLSNDRIFFVEFSKKEPL